MADLCDPPIPLGELCLQYLFERLLLAKHCCLRSLSGGLPIHRSRYVLFISVAGCCGVQEQAATPQGSDALRSAAYDVMEGDVPLHLAVTKGDADIVAALVEAGAKLDAKDGRDNTALDVSIELLCRSLDICQTRLLLPRGLNTFDAIFQLLSLECLESCSRILLFTFDPYPRVTTIPTLYIAGRTCAFFKPPSCLECWV